jgi:hypothetical protein
MNQNYKLDKLFGPSGTFAGFILFIVGLSTVYFTLTAIPLILLGAVMAFSFYESQIDPLKKCYRISLKLIGLYPVGKWNSFHNGDKILVQQYSGRHSTFSRGNRQLDIDVSDYRVVLIPEGSNTTVHLAKYPTEVQAQELARQLLAKLKISDHLRT